MKKLTPSNLIFFTMFLICMVITPIGYHFYDVANSGSSPGTLLFAAVMGMIWTLTLIATMKRP